MKSVCVCVLKKFSRKLKKEPHVCVNDRPTFVKIWKKRSVQEFSPAPYLATLVNCMVWTLYGLPIVHPNSILVVTINGSGVVIEIVYIILFLIYSPPKKRLKVFAWFVLDLIFMAALTVLTLTLAHTHKQRSAIVGTVCIIFNIMMYASPLAVMVCPSHSDPTDHKFFCLLTLILFYFELVLWIFSEILIKLLKSLNCLFFRKKIVCPT